MTAKKEKPRGRSRVPPPERVHADHKKEAKRLACRTSRKRRGRGA